MRTSFRESSFATPLKLLQKVTLLNRSFGLLIYHRVDLQEEESLGTTSLENAIHITSPLQWNSGRLVFTRTKL